jgi:hypothetical protein
VMVPALTLKLSEATNTPAGDVVEGLVKSIKNLVSSVVVGDVPMRMKFAPSPRLRTHYFPTKCLTSDSFSLHMYSMISPCDRLDR